MCVKMKFNFSLIVRFIYHKKVFEKSLLDIYDADSKGIGRSNEETRGCGVYAIYLGNELKKIGRAITGVGIFTRMSQYCRMGSGKSKYINKNNQKNVIVKYFKLETPKECWAAEKFLQAIAYYCHEKMDWDDEVH